MRLPIGFMAMTAGRVPALLAALTLTALWTAACPQAVAQGAAPSPQSPGDAVVLVATDSAGREGGTGFLLTHAGQTVVVSNAHVCDLAAPHPAIMFIKRGAASVQSRILVKHPQYDVCLLAPPTGIALTPLTIAPKGPEKGDQLRVYGHPRLRPLEMSKGAFDSFILAAPGDIDPASLLPIIIGVTTAFVDRGNSGSPVVDALDQVVGVAFACSLDSKKLGNCVPPGFFIPAPYIADAIREMPR